MPVEIQNPAASRADQDNLRRRDAVVSNLERVAPIVVNDRFPAVGILGPGAYRGGIVTTATDVTGSVASKVDGLVEFAAAGIVRSVVFQAGVTVRATANVMFYGCTFLAPITVASGGVIGCVGCRFDGTSCVTNAGLPVNANRVGCVGASPLSGDANVTIVGGV